jgi:hypothetical protein
VLAIGWLDTGQDFWLNPENCSPPKPVVFERAESPAEFIDQLVLVTRENLKLGVRHASFFICNLPACAPRSVREVRGLELGRGLVYVRHPRESKTLFCAPNLVLHYVVDHAYLPPRDFIEAVMAYRSGDLAIVSDKQGFRLR